MPESAGTDLTQPAGGESRGESAERTLAEVREQYPDTRDRETLKTWHYFAIARKYTTGMTWAEVAEEFDKSAGYLSRLASSPAGRAFREKIQSMGEVEIAEIALESAAIEVAQDYMLAREWAKKTKDYKTLRKITNDIADRIGLGKKSQQESGGQSIVINLDASSLDSPAVETRYEELEADIIDED